MVTPDGIQVLAVLRKSLITGPCAAIRGNLLCAVPVILEAVPGLAPHLFGLTLYHPPPFFSMLNTDFLSAPGKSQAPS